MHTDRMLLRRVAGTDLDWLARLHGDPAVMRFIGDGKPVPREVVVTQTLPAILREYASRARACPYLPRGLAGLPGRCGAR